MSPNEKKIREACLLLSRESKELYLTDRVAEVEERILPLKFYRDYVSKNIPLLIKNGIGHWKATKKWNISHFREIMGNKEISVAVTPNGYADAIAKNKNGKEYFVQPEDRNMKILEFLDELENPKDDEIFYIQRQNSNFENEYSELWRDVDQDIAWATEAFGKNPDAINFWMGDQRAVTSMHKDPYENIYCVVSGQKEFILHPPTDLPWIPYGKYPSAVYKKMTEDNEWIIDSVDDFKISFDLDDRGNDSNLIPWISVDPLDPDYKSYPNYKNVNTIRVKVEAGDILYLPSLWFHHVRQSHGCIAINYWYDMDYDVKYAYHLALQNLCE